MKKSAFQELNEVENSFWWHVGRKKIIEKQLSTIGNSNNQPLTILNVGAGTGGTIATLEKFGVVTNVDSSEEAIKYLQRNGYHGELFDGKKLPFADSSFDIVAALDVLEHILDGPGAIKDWLSVLKPGGTLLITVPAYQWLWSDHDVANMHFRRYTKRSLKKALNEFASLEVEKLSYMIVFSLPLIVGYRILGKAKKLIFKQNKLTAKTNLIELPRPVNSLFISLLSLEASMQKTIDFPFGTSVIARVRKPE